MEGSKVRKMIKRGKGDFFIFAFPTLIAFSIAFIYPFAAGLYLSFCSFTTVSDAVFVGIENYTAVFQNGGDFLAAFKFTFLFAIVSIVIINLFAFL